jgi:hypothetical protein
MKYNININQKAIAETKLDIIDASILDYVIFYCKSINKKIEKQRIKDEEGEWTWINFEVLLKDMPLLKIKSRGALTPRIRKIEEAGYITLKRIVNQKLFIKLTDKTDELFIEVNRAVHADEQKEEKSCSRRRTNNNTNNIDIYNNTNIISEDKPRNKEQELLNLFYRELNPNIKFNNKTMRGDAKWLVESYPFEKLEAMVLYIKQHQGEQYFPSITNPSQLREKMAQIINYKNREKISSKIIKI